MKSVTWEGQLPSGKGVGTESLSFQVPEKRVFLSFVLGEPKAKKLSPPPFSDGVPVCQFVCFG